MGRDHWEVEALLVGNIKMDLNDLGCVGVKLIHLAWIGPSGGLL
jgi:hypothetical protein